MTRRCEDLFGHVGWDLKESLRNFCNHRADSVVQCSIAPLLMTTYFSSKHLYGGSIRFYHFLAATREIAFIHLSVLPLYTCVTARRS